jgi:hypothetical protein
MQPQTSHSYKSVESVSKIELSEPCLGFTDADLVQPEPTVGGVPSPERLAPPSCHLPRRDPCSKDRMPDNTDLVPKDDCIASGATNPLRHCEVTIVHSPAVACPAWQG